MSADTPRRPDAPDDLARAYAQAQALADDGRRPAAAVRANVLAAARAVADEAARAATGPLPLPLAPVAPPVADVGRGRAAPINRSSWRVRSGAALCAMLLVGLAGWRFDAARRLHADEQQVAMAELRLAQAPTATLPRELALPPLSGASMPVVPPPVVEDRTDGAQAPVADARPARDKDVIVAHLDQKLEREALARDARHAAADAAAPARRMAPAPAAAPAAVPPAPAAAPVGAPADAASGEGRPGVQDPTTVTVLGEPQVVTEPARLPSVLPRRVVLAAAPPPDVSTAAPTPPPAAAADAARRSVPSANGSLVSASTRVVAPPLHAAADRGDVETLRKLLDGAATPVDAPDAAGRTALLHAVLAQRPAAVRLLLAAGADPARADGAGLTPRAAAEAGANAEIAALLAAPR